MQQTSLWAYQTLTNINDKQQRVLNALDKPMCNLEIAEKLNWPVNRVTPRVLELRNKGLVKESYKATSATGRTAIYWEAV